jgi:hypothetical protein
LEDAQGTVVGLEHEVHQLNNQLHPLLDLEPKPIVVDEPEGEVELVEDEPEEEVEPMEDEC